MGRLLSILAALVVCLSCAKGTPTNPLLPPGVSPTPLPQPAYVGIGRYQKLAEFTDAPPSFGVPFAAFVKVDQPQGASFPHRDVSGFVYAAKGVHILSRDDGERVQPLLEGAAGWVNPGTEHQNPATPNAAWYFVALRSIGQRNAPLGYPAYKVVYSTPDLPTPPAGKTLVHQLGLITMSPGGRTSSHSHGGSEAFYVLEGTIELALNNGTRTNISAGEGGSVKPGIVMQMRVLGDAPVTILTYFVTPQGEPWQTNLETLP
jgi:quercetin dioxygenase-like cupin family protein